LSLEDAALEDVAAAEALLSAADELAALDAAFEDAALLAALDAASVDAEELAALDEADPPPQPTRARHRAQTATMVIHASFPFMRTPFDAD
jgi:hypothetical protein